MTGREYMALVGNLPCVLCEALDHRQTERTEVHHYRAGTGMGIRASDWLVMALCSDCHRGQSGLHGDRSLLKIAGLDETGLLALTIRAVQS